MKKEGRGKMVEFLLLFYVGERMREERVVVGLAVRDKMRRKGKEV
jgi:hypothetical protein